MAVKRVEATADILASLCCAVQEARALKASGAKNDPSRKGSCKVFTGTQAAVGGAASRAPCVHTRPQGKTILQQCLAEKTQS